MTAFILDVSVTMAWCFEDEASEESWALLDRLAEDTAIVPGIWSAEVANASHRDDRSKAALGRAQDANPGPASMSPAHVTKH